MNEDDCDQEDREQEGRLRRELVHFSRSLSRLGFTPGTSGNLSVRLNGDRLLVTPTGMSKGYLKTGDMVITDLCGRLLAGTRNVTSEVAMHVVIYQGRPDVAAVIHAHPAIATAFACSGRPLDEVLCQEAVMTLGCVPLARYATTGTEEVANSLHPHLAGHDAVLLANHGVVSYGSTLLDAFMKMETVEHLAQVSLVAHQLGSARPLSSDQVQHLQCAKERYVNAARLNVAADSATKRTAGIPA